MGLAASQARLLTITSRLHDIELKQQNISNQKMRLSNESDEVSTAYSKALNTQRFTLNNGTSNVKMTVKNLLGADSKYKLMTKDGKRVVSKDQYEALTKISNKQESAVKSYYNNHYSSPNYNSEWCEAYVNTNTTYSNNKHGEMIIGNGAAAYAIMRMTGNTYNAFAQLNEKYGTDDSMSWNDKMAAWERATGGAISQENYDKYNAKFRSIVSMENMKTDSAGYIYSVDLKENAIFVSDSQMSDPNWLYNAIESGEFVLVDTSGKEVSTSSAKDIDTEYDKEVAARAEAEYNAATAKINRKEKILDNEARKLDTEYSAMNTEYESIKNIIKNNSDKTFNLFS